MVLNLLKNSKITVLIFFSISLFLYIWWVLVLDFKGKQVTFRVSFALVVGGVHFTVAELFSLTSLHSGIIFYTAP